MLTLGLPVELYWLDLPRRVRVETRPLTPPRLAADAYRRHLTRSLLG